MPGINDITSFLIINPFGIGDCLFTTPLMSLLRDHFPAAKIYFLCNQKTYPVVRDHPLVEKAFIYERDDFVKIRKISFLQWVRAYAAFIAAIRRERIDVCLDLSLNTQYGFYAWAAGIRRRFGLDYKKRCFFLNKKIPISGFNDKHVADYYLDTARFLDLPAFRHSMSIGIGAQDKIWAEDWISRHKIREFPMIIGVAPCGGDSFGPNAYIKRWPADHYSALIGHLREKYNAAVLVFAGPKESSDANAIIGCAGSGQGVYDLSNTTLGQTMALIAHCSLFIGNDTGALRFADALGKKLIAFYGPGDDTVYGPYPYEKGRTVVLKKDLACRPCYKRFRLSACEHDRECLRSISVKEAFDAAQTLLKN